MGQEFNYVELISITPRKLKRISVFKEYVPINSSITIHFQRKLFINKLTNLSLKYNELVELVKKNINDYNVIIIKIEDKHEDKSLKDLFIKLGIDAYLYKRDKKEIEIMNGIFIGKSSDERIMNKLAVCTSKIQVR